MPYADEERVEDEGGGVDGARLASLITGETSEARIRLPLDDDRPEIRVGVRVDRMATAAAKALCSDPETYQRGGALVHIARVDADDRSVRMPAGTPVVRTMGRATLRARLAERVRWTRVGRDKSGAEVLKETRPDEAAIGAVHEAGEWPGVRVLVGIAETPIVRDDGSIVQRPGYDRETGYVYVPSAEYPAIAAHPTQAAAAAALAELCAVFGDFPWSGEVDRYVAIAAILTVLARPAIDGAVPLITIDASTRGSGKTLATDAIALIATGRTAARTTYSDDEAETRKVLDGHAYAGARLVAFDNVAMPLGGATLDAYVTARDCVEVRILGKTGQLTLTWRALIVATGNNLEPRGDTIRRVLAARLEPNVERPEDRTGFRHADLVSHILAHRPRLVAAALTMVRAYVVANRPDMRVGSWGGFEAWARLVPPVIVYAGGSNVLAARLASSSLEVDRDAQAIDAILDLLPRLDRDGRGITARSIVQALYPDGRPPREGTPPDGHDEAREAIEHLAPARPGAAPNTTTLGNRLRGARARWIRGRRLVSTSGRGGVVRWLTESTAAVVGVVGLVGHSQPFAGEFSGSDQENGGRGTENAPRAPPAPPSGEREDAESDR